MRSINQKKSHKKLYTITSVVFILLLGLFIYVYIFNGSVFGWTLHRNANKSSSIDYSPATNEQKKAGDEVKSNTVTNPTKPSGSNSDTPPDPVPQAGGKSIVDMSITAVNQNGSIFQIRSLISTVTNTGTCTLVLTNGTKSVTRTSSVQSQSATSTCQGFDIPTAELNSGTWNIMLSFENSNLTGKTTKTITVE